MGSQKFSYHDFFFASILDDVFVFDLFIDIKIYEHFLLLFLGKLLSYLLVWVHLKSWD